MAVSYDFAARDLPPLLGIVFAFIGRRCIMPNALQVGTVALFEAYDSDEGLRKSACFWLQHPRGDGSKADSVCAYPIKHTQKIFHVYSDAVGLRLLHQGKTKTLFRRYLE